MFLFWGMVECIPTNYSHCLEYNRHSFIHSFSEYLLINYAVSLIFAKETVLNKTGMIKAIMDLVGKRER